MTIKSRLKQLERKRPARDIPRTLFEFEFATRSEFHQAIRDYSTLFPGQSVIGVEYGENCDLRENHPNFPDFDFER